MSTDPDKRPSLNDLQMEYLCVDGVRLEYRTIVPTSETAPTLVFLHEGLGCVAIWKDFPDRVAAATGCGALVFSRAGYGGSDPVVLPRPLSYLRDEGRRVLPAVLDAAGVSRAVLIGHSDGATIAIVNAGAVRDPRVIGAVLMAPHVFNEPSCVDGIRKLRGAYQSADLRQRLARYHGSNVDIAFWGWCQAWLDPGFRHWNIESLLPAIGIPLLVIQGHDDHYGTAAQIHAIERGVRQGRVTTRWLTDCGHSPFKDRPAATLKAIVQFVAECDGQHTEVS